MSVVRTVFTSEKDRTELVDEIMGSIAASLREQAVDTHMVIRPIEGEHLIGGVVTATDKTFDPSADREGEPSYPAVAEGTLFIDNVMITFTILTAMEWNSIAKDVVDALRGLTIDPISYASWKRSLPSFVTTKLPIPSQEWSIGFLSPPLTNKKEDSKNDGYQYMASSDRFTISIFVEQPKGDATSHTKCFEYYWPRARRNPAIQHETIQTTATPWYHRVQYDSKGTYKDRSYVQRSVNYFFAYAGRWVDVHISVIEPTETDIAIFNAMDLSLHYGK